VAPLAEALDSLADVRLLRPGPVGAHFEVLPMRLGTLLLFAPLLFVSAAGADGEWRDDGVVDGIHVEKREVTGSSFDELQVTAQSPGTLESLCLAVYPKPFSGKLEGRLKAKELLRETENERWTYERVSVPVVSDRDYVLHYKLEQAAPSGRCELSFETLSEGVRPSPPGVVRIPVIRGHWSLAPVAGGKVAIRYQIFTEPGGGVPAFLARSGMRDSAVDYMKIVLSKGVVARP
jgi:hypothetical protein